jgi:hypothetical protein
MTEQELIDELMNHLDQACTSLPVWVQSEYYSWLGNHHGGRRMVQLRWGKHTSYGQFIIGWMTPVYNQPSCAIVYIQHKVWLTGTPHLPCDEPSESAPPRQQDASPIDRELTPQEHEARTKKRTDDNLRDVFS